MLSSMRPITAAILTSAALILTTTGCGKSAPAKISVTGDITVKASSVEAGGEPCTARRPSEASLSTPVVVRDSSGKTVGLGSLGAAVYATDPNGPTSPKGPLSADCVFPFSVPDVPAGDSFYSIEVGNNGQVNFSQQDVAVPVHLTLG